MTYRKMVVKDILILFLITLMYILLMAGIFTFIVKADESNSNTLTGVISKPEVKGSKYWKWISFSAEDQALYLDLHFDLDLVENLSQNQTKVTITYLKHSTKTLPLFLLEARSKVAVRIEDTMDGTVYYDATVDYNIWVIGLKIVLIVIVTIVFCIAFSLFVFSLHVNLCSMKSKKKPKDQRVRAQNAVLTPEQRKNRSQARRRNQKRKK